MSKTYDNNEVREATPAEQIDISKNGGAVVDLNW